MTDLIPADKRAQLAELKGLVTEETGLRLAGLAALVPPELAIVEIGSFKGKSGCYLATGAVWGKGARVFCVDPWDSAGNETGKHGYAERATYESFISQVASMDLEGRITGIKGFSRDIAKFWRGEIGLLYIDGSHLFEDVLGDFRVWSKHMKRGAFLALDDYETPKNPGVKKAVEKIRRDYPAWKDGWDFSTPPLAITRKR